jgi:hypothetical protein
MFAILIPSTPERRNLLARLMTELDKQRAGYECIVIQYETPTEKNGGPTTGAKRNALIDEAIVQCATHIAFFDDDDLPGPTYVQRNIEFMESGCDTIELWGQYYEHGKQLNPFHHSIKYDKWWQDDKYYYRCNNHLNGMKLDKIKDFRFLDRTFGEDGNWAMDIQKAGVLKTEYPVKEITYFYFHGKRNHKLEPLMLQKRGISLH